MWFLARPDQLNPKNLNRESRTNAAHIMRLDMTAPTSVQKQAALADELQKQLANPSEDARIEPENKQEEMSPSAQEAEPAPVEQKQAPTEPVQQPTEAPSQEEDYLYWKNRFQVIQGKYNAEVPVLRKQVSELERALSEAKESQSKDIDQSAPQQVASALGDLSQDEIDEFGPELISLVQRIAGAQVNQSSEQVSSLNEKLSQTQDELKQIKDEKQDDQTSRFWADVQRRVPDFMSINSNPNFLAWLDGIDPTTGLQRQSILNSHQERLNAQGIAAVFDAFKQTVSNSVARNPEELQHPSQSNGHERGQSIANARIWTGKDIDEFYKNCSLNKYEPAEKEAIELEIFEATKTGRVRK